MKYVLVFICVAGLGFMLQSTDPATNPWNASAIEFDRTPISMPCMKCGSDCICESCVCKEQECLTTPVKYQVTTEDQFRIMQKEPVATEYSCRINAQGRMECGPMQKSQYNQGSTVKSQSSYSSRSGPIRRLGSRLRGFFSRFRCRGC